MTNFKFTKDDEKAANEVVKDVQSNLGESSLSTVPKSQEMAISGQFKGVNIEGLESIPASMVAVPFCRLIQPSSKNTTLADGQEAPVGSFMFNDIQKAQSELEFVLLRAKHDFRKVDRTGQFVTDDYIGELGQPKPVVSILGITTDTNKLFILSLSATSFSSFRKLIAKLKDLSVDKTWRFAFRATTEKKENDKGKFYIVNFEIEKELTEKEFEAMGKVAEEYGIVLDHQIIPEE